MILNDAHGYDMTETSSRMEYALAGISSEAMIVYTVRARPIRELIAAVSTSAGITDGWAAFLILRLLFLCLVRSILDDS